MVANHGVKKTSDGLLQALGCCKKRRVPTRALLLLLLRLLGYYYFFFCCCCCCWRRYDELNVATAIRLVTATARGRNPFCARSSLIFSAPVTVSELTTIASNASSTAGGPNGSVIPSARTRSCGFRALFIGCIIIVCIGERRWRRSKRRRKRRSTKGLGFRH